jgi:hypothetical protein
LLSFDGIVCNTNALLQWTGILGWGWPRSFRVIEKIIPSWQFKNNAPNSASAADTTTNRSIEHSMWNAPFNLMGFPSLGNHPRKKCPHALLQGLGSARFNVLEWIFMIKSDAQKRTLALG